MAAGKLDLDKVKDFLSKHLSEVTEAAKVKYRVINKALKHEFGQGLFIPKLSAIVNSIRPDLAKPKRGAGAKRRKGAKPGPKPGKRGAGRASAASGTFLVKIGRKMSLAKSRDRVQAVIDKMVAAGQSLGRLKVYALSKVGISTKVTID